MVMKGAELEVNQPNSVSSHNSLHLPLTPRRLSCRAPGSQAGTESKGAGVREEVSLVRDICNSSTWQRGPTAMPDVTAAFCSLDKASPGCSTSVLGKQPGKCCCSPLPSYRLGQHKSHRRTGCCPGSKAVSAIQSQACHLPASLCPAWCHPRLVQVC